MFLYTTWYITCVPRLVVAMVKGELLSWCQFSGGLNNFQVTKSSPTAWCSHHHCLNWLVFNVLLAWGCPLLSGVVDSGTCLNKLYTKLTWHRLHPNQICDICSQWAAADLKGLIASEVNTFALNNRHLFVLFLLLQFIQFRVGLLWKNWKACNSDKY